MDTAQLPKLVWIPIVVLAVFGLMVLAVPSHSHDHSAALAASAAATLKSGIFPAQVQFQSMPVLDQDGNGTGEYGLLSELSGRRAVGRCAPGELSYLSGPLSRGDLSNGYRFALYLPNGAGGALGEPAGEGPRRAVAKEAISLQERHFVAYAWPEQTDGGRHMYAISEDGRIRYAPWMGVPPAWDALWAGRGWGAAAVWPVFAK